MLNYLQLYDNASEANILSEGFQNGFRIDYEGPRQFYTCKNLKSAIENEEILLEKINTELSLKRFAGPYERPPFADLRVSPLGLVPKSDSGWRMITHLSFPRGASVNDGIDHSFSTVQYTSFDNVTTMIYSLGQSALIAKRDLKSAYRLLPMHPESFPLLGLKVNNSYYVDKLLRFGLA